MKQVVAILLLMCGSIATAADPVVVLRDDGTYVLQPDSMTLVKAVLVDQRSGGNPGPTPTPSPPTGSGVTADTERMATAVGNKSESALLGAIYALFAREVKSGAISAMNARQAITTARNVGLAGTNGVERWKNVGDALDRKMLAVVDAELSTFFGQVRDGFAKAAGVDPGVFDKVSSPSVGAEYAESAAAPAGFDWTVIFQIIMQILQLLRDLGIFG